MGPDAQRSGAREPRPEPTSVEAGDAGDAGEEPDMPRCQRNQQTYDVSTFSPRSALRFVTPPEVRQYAISPRSPVGRREAHSPQKHRAWRITRHRAFPVLHRLWSGRYRSFRQKEAPR